MRRWAAAVGARRGRGARPFFLGEILVVVFLLVGFDRIARLANSRGREAGQHGWAVWRTEQFLHVDVELRLNHLLAPHRLLGQIVSAYYDFAHSAVTVATLFFLYVLRAPLYRSARNALLLVNAVALVVFFAVPVAPPRLLSGAGFVDVVGRSGTWGAAEGGAESAASAHADLYAAMPSLHLAWATWVVVAVFLASRSRVLRTVACVHLGLTTFGVLGTANHYVLDVVAGAVLGGAAWWAARRWSGRRQERAAR